LKEGCGSGINGIIRSEFTKTEEESKAVKWSQMFLSHLFHFYILNLKVCEVKGSMGRLIQQIKTSDEIKPQLKLKQQAARSELVKSIVLHGFPLSLELIHSLACIMMLHLPMCSYLKPNFPIYLYGICRSTFTRANTWRG
jgi:hypothetical protein